MEFSFARLAAGGTDAPTTGRTPRIESGTATDRDRCVGLWLASLEHRDGLAPPSGTAERALGKLERPQIAWPVVRDAEGRAIAFALMLEPGSGGYPDDDPRAAYLGLLAVHPAAQQRGLGRMVLDAAVDAAREAGHPLALLHVMRSNVAAVALYASAGWRAVGDAVPHALSGELMQTYVLDLTRPAI